MDQIHNSMLNVMTQAVPERQSTRPQPQEKEDFQSQMNKAAGQDVKAEAKTAEQPQNQEGQPAAAAEDPKELEKQMVLAAMAVLQNPVVPVEQAAAPEEVQAVDAVLTEPAVPVVETEAAPQAAETVEILPEELPAEAVEQLPQEEAKPVETAAEAPAAENPVSDKVEIKVAEADSGETEQERGAQDAPEESMAEAPVFREVRDIPVKVGEAPAGEEIREVPVENQIAPKLAQALEQGDTRVEIQLEPENLGKVTVEVTLHEDGALHIALHAENSQTRGLLERSSDSLAAMLGRDARQEVQVEVPRQQESQQQNFYERQQNQEHQQQQQQREHRRERQGGEDFLHQLRLGLIPGDGE